MVEYYLVLRKILLGIEFVSALVGFMYILKLKNSYWKWFSIYLIFIFFQEFLTSDKASFFDFSKRDYYTYIGVPVQYLFLFWLFYA